MSSSSSQEQKVPVFVFPQNVTFYLDDQTTYKQVLTLYNPYDFTVKFKVLCTAPAKFSVVDPAGVIKPQCCADIVIRHNAVIPAHVNVTDKFRIQMHDSSTKQLIGKRDVTAQLLPGRPEAHAELERDHTQRPPVGARAQTPQQHPYLFREARAAGRTPNFVVLLVALLCCVALMLPHEGEPSSFFPFHLSVNFKLVLAYVLGLVTMVILKPS